MVVLLLILMLLLLVMLLSGVTNGWAVVMTLMTYDAERKSGIETVF